ncbi:MAG: hypothetical protein U0T83_02715 [Bacteriovoracaceae bacterium]
MKIISMLLLSMILLPASLFAKTCLKKDEPLSISFDIREYSFFTEVEKEIEIQSINVGNCNGIYSVKNNYHAPSLKMNDAYFELNSDTWEVSIVSNSNKQKKIVIGTVDPIFLNRPTKIYDLSIIYKGVPLKFTEKRPLIVQKAIVSSYFAIFSIAKAYPSLTNSSIANEYDITSRNQLKLKVWDKNSKKIIDLSINR